MIVCCIEIVLALTLGGSVVVGEPVSLPKDVPPVLGMAMVSDPPKSGENMEWTIRLTLPQIAWEVVGKMVPKKEWPGLKAEVEMATRTLRMDGPWALAPSRVVDLKGMELSRDQVVKRLKEETPVLLSVSGRMPDSYFLQLTTPDALIVILGPRDGYPAPELLPAKKAAAAKPDKDGDQ